MDILKKKSDPSLEELERETETLTKKPRLPPRPQRPALPPAAVPPAPPGMPPLPRKPLATPVTSEEKARLTTKQVAKLPLFMKIDQYARILHKLNILVDAFKEMDEILDKMEDIEKDEQEEIQKWRAQLETTKTQVKSLLSEMPETGKLASVIRERKKEEIESKVKKEVEGLKKEVTPKKKSVQGISPDIKALRDSVKTLQEELKNLNIEFQKLGSTQKTKSIKAGPKPSESKQVIYKKGKTKSPWE